MVRHCLWKMYATPGACINETGLFSSAAVVPQNKSTELCSSSVAVVPHKVNLPSCVVARWPLCHKVNLLSCVVAQRPLCHKVSLPRCEARRRLFILTCDIFGSGQTNIFALCYLNSEKLLNQPTLAPLK